MRKKIIFYIVVIVAVILLATGYYLQFNPKVATVTFGDLVAFKCEVADTSELIQSSLLHTRELSKDNGVLLAFPVSNFYSVSMKGLLLPLDIIFIGDNETILNVEHAQVQHFVNESQYTLYSSKGQVRWIVLINYGLTDTYGIQPGMKVTMKY